MTQAEVMRIGAQYETDFLSPARDERIADATILVAAGYTIQHCFLAPGHMLGNNATPAEKRLVSAELDKWRKADREGVAGPYVDFKAPGGDPFAPEASLAYWQPTSQEA